jgi:thiosulfate dehydrogenase
MMRGGASHALLVIVIAVLAGAAVSCALHQTSESLATDQARVNAAATIPPGPDGQLIRYGRDIIVSTPAFAGSYITARMSCGACHPHGGTVAHQGSFIGTYAKFPQWNKRSGRFIALQDRIAECFLYSMNGHPPAYYSREMIAITAYIAWLSRGSKVGEGFASEGPLKIAAAQSPNRAHGATVYAAQCMRCHGADGNGNGSAIPPLWGAQSFNDKAGMARMDRIAPFVYAAMPADKPGTLKVQDAFDVAAFVLAKARPHFNKQRRIRFPTEPSGFF